MVTMEISADVLHLFLYGRLRRNTDELLYHKLSKPVDFPKEVTDDTCSTTLPNEVCILPSTIPGADLGVFCATEIAAGTKMGPYTGKILAKCPDAKCSVSTNAWEILSAEGKVVGYIDGGSHPTSNWLAYVQCARTEHEQNLEGVQMGNQIYYRAIKEICRGEELLVWYGNSYVMYMGVPYSFNKTSDVQALGFVKDDMPWNTNITTESMGPVRWRCVLCQRGFNSRSNLRSHMRIHTLEKPFTCKFCGRKFSQSSTLRNHVRLHTGEKPYKCPGCKSSYSQLAGLRAHQRSSTHKPPIARDTIS